MNSLYTQNLIQNKQQKPVALHTELPLNFCIFALIYFILYQRYKSYIQVYRFMTSKMSKKIPFPRYRQSLPTKKSEIIMKGTVYFTEKKNNFVEYLSVG